MSSLILLSIAAYSGIEFSTRYIFKNNKYNKEYGEFVASTINAIVTCTLSTIALMDPNLWNDKLYYTNSTGLTSLYCISGYFVYEVLMCLQKEFDIKNKLFIFHGLVGMQLGLLASYYKLALFYYIGLSLMEFSTPFVNCRNFLKLYKLKNIYVDLLLFVSFLSCRVLWGSYVYILIVQDMYADRVYSVYIKLPLIFTITSFMGLSYYWFYLMFKIFYSKIKFFLK